MKSLAIFLRPLLLCLAILTFRDGLTLLGALFAFLFTLTIEDHA